MKWLLLFADSFLRKNVKNFPGGPMVKDLPANAGDMSSIPGPGRSYMPGGYISPCAQILRLCSKACELQLLKPQAPYSLCSATREATWGSRMAGASTLSGVSWVVGFATAGGQEVGGARVTGTLGVEVQGCHSCRQGSGLAGTSMAGGTGLEAPLLVLPSSPCL